VSYVTAAQVQQWLESTKLGIDGVDTELESSAAEYIKAQLASLTDTTVWVDAASTPVLVVKLMSMLIAAWIYERTYSEQDSTQPTWGARLEHMVATVITGLTSGVIALIDSPIAEQTWQPEYWPNDDTAVYQAFDIWGKEVVPMGSEDIKFTMGQKF
jgi:hypothetical protein